MDPDSRAIYFVVLMFIGAAYCAMTETALSSASRNKIKIKADKGNKRAKTVLGILDDFDDAITTLLICTNICHISAASCVTAVVTRKWGLSAVTASTFIMTLAMFFVGEMLPKSIGKKMSEQVCLVTGGLLKVLMKILKPLSGVLSAIGAFTMKLIKSDDDEVSVTKNEIYDIIEDMTEEGSLDEDQSELISSALSFGDLTVGSIVTPRVDIEGVDINMPPEEVLKFVEGHNHSRLVVYDGTTDNIVGVLRIRPFLKMYISRKTIPNVRKMMDEVYYAHQSMPIDELLGIMSEKRLNMAVVLDGFGGTLGIVTIEDILEEIVGEIWDEDDEIDEPVVELSDDTFLASADETVDTIFGYMNYKESNDSEAERFKNLIMADWVIERTKEIPKVGDSFTWQNLTVRIEETEHNRIRKVKITKVTEESPEKTDDKSEKKAGESSVDNQGCERAAAKEDKEGKS